MSNLDRKERDRNYLEGVINGNKTAFERLFHAYYGGLCRFATGYISSPEGAEDLVLAEVLNDTTGGIGGAAHLLSNATEAWGHLKREPMIDLWLEGRRMGDRRRWIEDDAVPNEHPNQDLPGRDYCWPIGQTELESNDNVTSADNDLGAPYDY